MPAKALGNVYFKCSSCCYNGRFNKKKKKITDAFEDIMYTLVALVKITILSPVNILSVSTHLYPKLFFSNYRRLSSINVLLVININNS